MNNNNAKQVIRDTVRRFQHLPSKTIARILISEYGELFDNDLEKARKRVRNVRGQSGKHIREVTADKSLYLDKTTALKMPETWRKPIAHYKLPEGLWLVLSDIHVPFHEPLPIEAAFQSGHAEKVDGILLNGDAQDCASVSFWPTAKRQFNREVAAFIDFLDFMRQEFPTQKVVYKPGNHEYRLPRHYVSKMPELAESPLSAMETVIGFEERDIEFLDYHQLVMAGELPIIHGHEIRGTSTAVNAARGLFLKTKSFSACSHWHSTSMHSAKNIHGEYLTTWSFGCLCQLNPEYSPFGNDWNWGFGLVNVEKNGDFELINRRVLPSGKVV